MQLLASTDPNRQPNTTTAGNGDVSTFNPMATSDKALLQRQREVMKMQDEMLGDIEKGVDRLHNQVLLRACNLDLFSYSLIRHEKLEKKLKYIQKY